MASRVRYMGTFMYSRSISKVQCVMHDKPDCDSFDLYNEVSINFTIYIYMICVIPEKIVIVTIIPSQSQIQDDSTDIKPGPN